jgi:hypothetical protein
MTQQDRFYRIFSPVLKGIIHLRRARRIRRSPHRCLPEVHLDTDGIQMLSTSPSCEFIFTSSSSSDDDEEYSDSLSVISLINY